VPEWPVTLSAAHPRRPAHEPAHFIETRTESFRFRRTVEKRKSTEKGTRRRDCARLVQTPALPGDQTNAGETKQSINIQVGQI
jgi:hypothetical protein